MAVNLFDPNYYRKANADLAGMSDAQAQAHFQQYGLNEGRSFSPFADLNFYRASNSDLAGMTNQQAFEHLQQYGIAEGRTFCPFVDLNFYKSANSDLAGMTNQQAFEHLQQYGITEGRTFSQFFNSDYYRRANTDLPSLNNRQLLEHLEQYGLDEGRNFSAGFDANYYRNANRDLAAAGLTDKQLYNHFRLYGIAESRDSSPIFNVKSYLEDANNADLRSLKPAQAHEHFNVYGYREGRFGCADYAGNTLSDARAIDPSSNNATFKDFVGANDTDDYYRFTLTKPISSNVTLDGLGANANVEVIADANNNGIVDDKEVIKSSNNSPTNKDVFSGNLNPGTYYIHVSASGTANTSYQLKLSTTDKLPNVAPSLDLNGEAEGINYTTSFTEDGKAVAIVDSAKLSITDADNTQLKSATVKIDNLKADDVLAAVTGDTNIAAKYDAKTGVLNLSGEDTLANYENVLRSVTYNNTSQNPDATERQITFTINDGTIDSEIATSTLAVNAVNDAPSLDLNGEAEGINYTTSFTEDGKAVAIVDSAKLSITDADNTQLKSATVKIDNLKADDVLAAVTGDTNIAAKYDAKTGVLNLSGEDTLANYENVLRSVTYNNTSQNPDATERQITFTINDGTIDSEIATSTLAVTAVNDAPSLDLNGEAEGINYTTSFTEDGKAVAIVDSAKLSITDADNTQLKSATVKIDNLKADDVLAAVTGDTNIAAKYDAKTGVLNLSGEDTLANYENVLRSVTYNNTSQNPDATERQITFTINDGTIDSEIATSTLAVTAVNDAPSLDLNGEAEGINYTTSFTEDGKAVAIVDSAKLSITDADNTQLKSATVKIDNLKADDVLAAVTGDTNIAAKYDAKTGVLNLSGEDTLANYENVLRSVTYNNTSQNPDATERQITFTINDGTIDSEIATSTLAVNAVNDAPSLDLNGEAEGINYTTSFNIGREAVAVVDSAMLSSSDIDNDSLASATVKIVNQINSSDEELKANTDGTNIKASYDPATDTLSLKGEDTAEHYKQVLGSVTYNNKSPNPTTTERKIQFTINDGKVDSEIATSTVNVNNPSVLDLDGFEDGIDYTASFTEDGGAVAIVNSDNLSVTDANNTTLKSASIKIDNVKADDVLEAVTDGTSITANYDATSGELKLSGDDTLGNYENVLRTVTYNNTSQNPDTTDRTIKFTINDGITDSDIATSTVAVNAFNDDPVVDLNGSGDGIDYTTEFTEDGSAVAVVDSANLSISDDNTTLQSATVKINNLQIDDVLAAVTNGTNINASYDNGELSLSGEDTVANYQQVLGSVTYNNTSQNPDTTAPREIAFTVYDGEAYSEIATSTVAVTAQNDAPVVDLNGSATGINYIGAIFSTGKSPVAVVDSANLSITDVDNTTLKSATVKIDNLINGSNEKLEANTTDSGITSTYDSKTGILKLTGDADVAIYEQVLGSVTYNNTSPNPTTTARKITFTISDGTTSSAIATSTVSINKPPVVDLNGSATGKDYSSATFTEDGAAVAVVSTNLTVTDANNTKLKSATVQISNLQNGKDEVLAATKTGNITTNYDDATGKLTLTGDDTLANYQQVLRSVTYNNTSQNPDTTAARQITFTLNDGITDSDVATSTVAVKAVNDKPVVDLNGDSVDGKNYTASFTEDGQPVAIVGKDNLSITDIDNTNLTSATVKINNLKEGDELAAVKGATSITVDYNKTTGELSLSGDDTLANYQTVLRSVTYNNTSQNPDTTARQIKFTIKDGTIDSEIATSTVAVNAVNDAPVVDLNGSSVDGKNYSSAVFTEKGGAVAIVDKDNLSVTDVDNTQIKSATVKIINPPNGIAEELTATTTGTSITSNYNSTTGTLTLTGDDILANYQKVLRSVTYNNTSQNPDTNPRSIQFRIYDGTNDSEIATSMVAVNAVNDAPTMSALNPRYIQSSWFEYTLSNNELKATDPDNAPGDITYQIVSAPTNGSVRLGYPNSVQTNRFTQADINSGKLTYYRNSTSDDSFTFTVADAAGAKAVDPADGDNLFTFNIYYSA